MYAEVASDSHTFLTHFHHHIHITRTITASHFTQTTISLKATIGSNNRFLSNSHTIFGSIAIYFFIT